MKSMNNGSTLRLLDSSELDQVAGGDDQEGPEVVVTATREQVKAANMAYDRAWGDYFTFSVVGMGALGGAMALGYGGAAGAASAGAGAQALSMTQDRIINSMADDLYYYDGRDGVYDGINAGDRAQWAHEQSLYANGFSHF